MMHKRYCSKCKSISSLKDACAQTENPQLIPKKTTFHSRFLSSPNYFRAEFVRVKASKGDTEGALIYLDDCSLSSIESEEYTETNYLYTNTLKDEILQTKNSVLSKDEINEISRATQPLYKTTCVTPDLFAVANEKLREINTPSSKQNKFSMLSTEDLNDFSGNYEEMMEKISNSKSGDFKKCFKKLMRIEKKSVHEDFFKSVGIDFNVL